MYMKKDVVKKMIGTKIIVPFNMKYNMCTNFFLKAIIKVL